MCCHNIEYDFHDHVHNCHQLNQNLSQDAHHCGYITKLEKKSPKKKKKKKLSYISRSLFNSLKIIMRTGGVYISEPSQLHDVLERTRIRDSK